MYTFWCWTLNAVLLLFFLLFFLCIFWVLCESFVISFFFFSFYFFPSAFPFFRLRLYISTVRIRIYIFRITFTCKGITECQCECVSCAIVTLNDWLANTDSNRLRLDDRMWEPHTNCYICLCVVSFCCVFICMWIYLKDYPPISIHWAHRVHLFHIFPSLFVWMYFMLFGFHFVSFSFMTVIIIILLFFIFPFLLYFGDLLLLNWVLFEFVSSAVFVFRVRLRFYPIVY